MSSGTSTERRREDADAGLQPRHLFLLLSMIGATAAVMVVGKGHPLALVVLSLTVVAAGLVGIALQGALAGFFGTGRATPEPRGERATDALVREKALVLRSIKELEFDKAMGKVAEEDFANISKRLRARAVALMQELDLAAAAPPPAPEAAPGRKTRPDGAPSPRSDGAPGLRPSTSAGRPEPVEGQTRRPDAPAAFCGQCGTPADAGQRFCKACGARL